MYSYFNKTLLKLTLVILVYSLCNNWFSSIAEKVENMIHVDSKLHVVRKYTHRQQLQSCLSSSFQLGQNIHMGRSIIQYGDTSIELQL